MKRKLHVYCLYKGDKFVDVGTASELADKLHCTTGYIYHITCDYMRKMDNNGSRLLAYRLEDDVE